MQKYLLIFAFIFTAGMLSAQGWERTYPGSGNDEVQAVAQTPDGGFIMAGQRNLFSFYLIKADADGFLEWNKVYPAINAYGKSIQVTQDSHYVVAGYIGNGINRDAYLTKTDQFGNIIWSKTFGGAEADEANRVIELPDGSLVICGINRATTTANDDILLIKTDANGNLIWEKTVGQSDKEEAANDITLMPNGDIVVAGTVTDGPDRDVYVARFDTDGNQVWENTYSFSPGTGGNDQASAVIATADGDLVIAGRTLFVQDGALLFKITGDGDDIPVWIKTYPFTSFRDITTDQSNGFYVSGSKTLTLAQGDLFIGHFDFEGDKLWEALAGKAGPDDGFTVIATENGAASAGVSTPFFGSFEVIPYLVRTDANGLIYTSYIKGEIFNDLNGNCQKDTDEPVMEDWIVQAKNAQTEKYSAANTFGEYLFRVDTGVYDLKLIAPNKYWQSCTDVIQVAVPDFYDTVSVAIPVQLKFSCPNNEVDVATSLLRRCADNVYTVRYCNNGTTPSLNTKVDVTLDPYMTLTSSSINWSAQNGNTYTFDIGTLNAGDCGNFTVTAFLACVTSGESSAHCVSAYITPDSICNPDPAWDGAIIVAEAKCENDTVKMILKNRGAGNMGERLDYVIIEDVIMLTQPGTLDFILNSNQDTTVFSQPANGKSYRVFAEQSPFFPFQSYPTAAVEGCVPDNNPDPVSLGFYTMFPEDDGAPYASSDCQESSAADFNPTFLKRGHPKGYDEPHYVSPGTDLDFLIRFRNTGADTLQQVVIRDTLSEWLDPATVRPGAASHFYDYQLYGNGIVKFTFPNINLAPDSSASEGYVKFRVSQKPELPCGTEILNSAAIYFDFNAPVITNVTYNTVCDSFLVLSTDNVQWLGADVQVFPNPFSESAFFNVSGVQAQSYTLELYDIHGRLLFNQSYQQPTFRLYRHQIPAGMIFYRLTAEGKPVATGKLIATTQ